MKLFITQIAPLLRESEHGIDVFGGRKKLFGSFGDVFFASSQNGQNQSSWDLLVNINFLYHEKTKKQDIETLTEA